MDRSHAVPPHRDEAEVIAGFGQWHWSPAEGLSCSAGLLHMLNRADAPYGRTLLRGLSPRDRLLLVSALRQARLGTTPDPVELHYTDARRDMRTVSVSVRPDGEGIWGVCQDVTTLRRVASALDRSETRWETALFTAGQGVWDSDMQAGIVYHSRTWRSMRGMNPDGDPQDSHEFWASRVHPDDLQRVLAQSAEQHAGKIGRVVMEYRERHRDGHYIWIASHGAPVAWFANGKPSRIIGTDTDITDRKRSEEALLHLSRRLQISLETSRIGVFEANLQTGELHWDMRCREMYGLPTEGEIGPTQWEGYLHPEDAAGAIFRVTRAAEQQTTYTSDFRIIRATDGAVRTIRTQGTWYRDTLGVERIVGANMDITEEVAAKQELERSKDLAEARNRELEIAKAHIEHHALHDTLTGLPNRRYLDDVLTERAARARESGAGIGLLHIDLDRFKQINDTLGHVAGDAMLVHVARLLRDHTGPGDFVARVGGDEFVVVAEFGGDREPLGQLATRLIERMRRPVPYHGHHCRFGASIGIATQAGEEVDPARLLVDADIALYLAKARGKNGFQFFSQELQAQAIHTKNTADDILAGVELDQFLPYYQPVYDARTMRLAAVEALARWQHPRRGVLLPSSFLKIAEDLNVVTAIDSAILNKALDDMRRWTGAGLEVPALSVNVSFRRLSDEHLVDSLRCISFAPGSLSFELLESIFLDDVDEVVRFNLDQIRDLGIQLSIDDFGTGHASVLSLLKLRPDRLKIDRQFLEHLDTSESQQRLVGSLIDIGKSLGIKVVAEGVETEAQVEILRRLGVDMLQGFVFARPMPASELEKLLAGPANRVAS